MKPITTSFLTGKDTCSPISSDCIVWNGPNIPCISDPCNGESATNVLQLMADKLCELSTELSDALEVDLSCLLDGEPPTTLAELQQLIVNKVCEALDNAGGGGTDPGTQKTLYPLPLCLQYVDGDQNTITSAELADFLDLVSDKVCEIVGDLTAIDTQISDLDDRVTILENATPTVTPASLPNVTLVCTNSTPGIAKPITNALVEFENAYCQFRVLTGSNSELSAVISKECASLDTSASLSNSDLLMNELDGWVSTPTNIAQMMNNMWITLCDIRSQVITCCSNIAVACSPFPVTKISVTNVNDQSFDVSWSNPNVGSFETPTEFKIEVFEVLNNQPTGSAEISETYPYGTTHPITVLNTLTADQPYALVITAVYSCGSASTTYIGVLNESIPLNLCLEITESDLPNTTITCDGGSYTQINKKLTFTLYNGTDLYQAPNNIGIQIVLERFDDCANSTTSSVANFTLNQGNASVDYNYAATTYVFCQARSTCSPVTLLPQCISITGNGLTINLCDEASKIGICNVIPN